MLKEKINENLASVKFQLKTVLCLDCAVANVEMSEDQIRQNLTLAINYLFLYWRKDGIILKV